MKRNKFKKYLLIISLTILILLLLFLIGLISIFGLPLPAKKYSYTGRRQTELLELSKNSSLPREQEKLEVVLDAVYIADLKELASLTKTYYQAYFVLPWRRKFEPSLLRNVEGFSKLKQAAGTTSDYFYDSFQKIVNKDIYMSDNGNEVYWCVDLLRLSEKEIWEGNKCNSITNCYCEKVQLK